ncbi:MAG: iron-sulfur cluster assembly scaffold protein [Ardenticatenaceae bacterium]|nr:iron-sulfur cluster assembly scaffold protein [Ardenticatenaceae bacterium]
MSSRQDYIDFILDHYENPRNRGRLDPADATAKGGNPGCGDIVVISLNIDPETRVITEARFEGEGCTISQAAASAATEMIAGKTIDEILEMSGDDLVEILGRDLVSGRIRCATLGIHTVRAALRKYQAARRMDQIEADRVVDQGRELGLEFE